MSNIGNIGGSAAVTANNQPVENTASQATSFAHSQLGAGTAAGLDTSMFEEAAMNIASFKKIKTKDDKKDKDTLKKLLDELKSKVPDLPPAEKLDQCLDKLKQQMKSGNLSHDDIEKQLKEYSGDSTHQYIALEDLIAQLQESGENEALLEELQAYKADFYEKNQQDIQAGLNVSAMASEIAGNSSLGNESDLRDVWRAALRVPELHSAAEAFQFAKARVNDDYEKVGEGIAWMEKCLAGELDLTQAEQSVDPVRMLHVRSQLESVFGVKTIYDQCTNLEGKLDGLIANEREG
ncbi:MAG: hypothetical protein OXC48_02305 [Endozoicomonadaceae bacterium]|nr:hypothetical protein [Endozoicomonadaceae bacterium]